MENRNYWEDNLHPVKLDHYNPNDAFGRVAGDQLNFAAASEDEAEYPPGAYMKKGKVSRQDPLSHRIIEKRRRDRMNNCLADLSRLIPPEYLKKGRGRVEKTEIIEMAIRHLKYLQDRANVADRQSEDTFRAGFQEAVGETVRFLVDVQGYEQVDGLCATLSTHLQRHVEAVTKGEVPREKVRTGYSSETASSSGSSLGYASKSSVISHQQPPLPGPQPPPPYQEPYDAPLEPYPMDCEIVPVSDEFEPLEEPLPLDTGMKCSPTLRDVRKPEQTDDYLHSYKFKNSIERRFSRSQDNEPTDLCRGVGHNKAYSHKRRRAARPALPAPSSISTATSTSASNSASTSTSGSASTEEARDTSPQQDTTSSESPHMHHHYDRPKSAVQYVPIFALNAVGKYYVPMSVEAACVARHERALAAPPAHAPAPLHPVTIHVNFTPCLDYHVKREHPDRD